MLEISNPAKFKIDSVFLNRVEKLVLAGEKKEGLISLVLVSPQKIKSLNKKWRDIDIATDVLSFELDKEKTLGEIYLCPQFIKKRYNEWQTETMRALIHGILHLLSYKHDNKKQLEKIISLENKYIRQYGKKYSGKRN